MYKSEGVGLDGRPLVEVTEVVVDLGQIEIAGTASVYEANVLVEVTTSSGSNMTAVQASAGGPERGAFAAVLVVEVYPVEVRVGGEDAEDGGMLARSRVVLRVDGAGSVSQVA